MVWYGIHPKRHRAGLNPTGTPPHAKYICRWPPPAQHFLPLLINQSIKIVLVDLIRHDHHPEQKHRPDDVERKHRLPVLADALRLQPGERRLPVGDAAAGPVEVAVRVDGTRGAVELDGGFDEAGQEEDEEDEGAQDDDAGEELALLD